MGAFFAALHTRTPSAYTNNTEKCSMVHGGVYKPYNSIIYVYIFYEQHILNAGTNAGHSFTVIRCALEINVVGACVFVCLRVYACVCVCGRTRSGVQGDWDKLGAGVREVLSRCGRAVSAAVSECKSPVNINVKCTDTNKCRTNPMRSPGKLAGLGRSRWACKWAGIGAPGV